MPIPGKHIAATAFCILCALMLAACSGSATKQTLAKPQKSISFYAKDKVVSADRLKQTIEPFFEDRALGQTHAVIVMHGGQIVAERYAPGYSPESRFISWSMGKSVVGVLMGMMIADGRLTLDQDAPEPDWQSPGDPRNKITIKHLLQMSAGLDHSEGPNAENGERIDLSDTPRMLFTDGRDDVARYAVARPLEAAPGEKWEYSTVSTHILVDIMTRSLTESTDPDARRTEMLQYIQGRLFDPLDMKSGFAEFDRSGTMLGGSMIHATARDWTKFGEFLRNNGSVRSAKLLPQAWVDFMRTPLAGNPSYGAQLWLNRRALSGQEQVLFPGRAPGDVFAALGHLGQFIVVSPQHRLVIVRLGTTADDKLGPVDDQLAKVIALFPKG
jgi:CubicO group peptidase (beta-lactamase class C family)